MDDRSFRLASIALLATALPVAAFAADAAAPAPEAPATEAPVPPRRTEPLPGKSSDADKPPAQVPLATRLKETKVTLEYADTPLILVLENLRDASGIDFAIDAKLLERFKTDPMKVTMTIREIPLESALKLLLSGKRLAAVERKGALLIVPQAELGQEIVVRVYDIRDLVALKLRDAPAPTELGLPRQENGKAGGGDDDGTVDAKRTHVIVDVIRKSCGGTSWETSPNTSIALNNGLLIVAQSRRVHAEIQRLIDLLRKSQ